MSNTNLADDLIRYVRQNPEHAHRGVLLDYAVDIEGATEAEAATAVDQLDRDGHLNGQVTVGVHGKSGKRTMEVKLIERLLGLRPNHAHFVVILAMSQRINWQTGRTYVSVTALADITGCTRKTVAKAITWAEEVGIIVHREKAFPNRPDSDQMAYTFDAELLSDYRRGR